MPICYEIYNQKVKIYIGEEIPSKKKVEKKKAGQGQLKKLHIQIMFI